MVLDKCFEKDIRTPYELAIDELGGRWKPRIISLLAVYGKMRYAELRHSLGGISDTVLAGALKELLRDGIVIRFNYSETTPHVEYALTRKGLAGRTALMTVCAWEYHYHPEMALHAPSRCQSCELRIQALQALETEGMLPSDDGRDYSEWPPEPPVDKASASQGKEA